MTMRDTTLVFMRRHWREENERLRLQNRDLRALVERLAEFPSCPDRLILAVLVAEANQCLDQYALRTYTKGRSHG